jgi:UDP-glucose 4-epimerase
MRSLVTGGAGFIGSHLCDRLIEAGDEVWAVDNLHLGTLRNIEHLRANPRFHFEEFSVLDQSRLGGLFRDSKFDRVFHLAANSDIAAGIDNVDIDLDLNQLTTVRLLQAMKSHGVAKLFFASTSAVFGENEASLAENDGPLQPISFYGASKLAAEAYVSVHAHTFGIQSVVIRFPNVVGERATHGAIFDFIKKLKADPARLIVLGNGLQTKPYMYVADLVDAILLACSRATDPLTVYHAAGTGSTSVREIAETVIANFGRPDTVIQYTGGDRGWPGDVPRFSYNTERLRGIGWKPKLDSAQAVRHAVEQIRANGF